MKKDSAKGWETMADNIVEVVYCNSRYELSRQLTIELMEKYPDLKMIAGMNEYSSVGAARAVKASGAKDRVAGSWCGQFSGSRSAYGERSVQRPGGTEGV